MGTLRFFEEVVSFKIRRTFGFADYTGGLLSSGRVRSGFCCAWLRLWLHGRRCRRQCTVPGRPLRRPRPVGRAGIRSAPCPAACGVRRAAARSTMAASRIFRTSSSSRISARRNRCSTRASDAAGAATNVPAPCRTFRNPRSDSIRTASRTVERPTPNMRINSDSVGSRSPVRNFPAAIRRCSRWANVSASECLRRGVCGPDFIVSSDVLRKGKRFFRIGEISGAEFRRRVRSQWKNGSREWGGERQEASMSFPAGIHRSAAPLIY